ncbi:predicted protein [Streptomyces filamentosus NRRL 15998]|uniref:Predicted protein n=1 Tax=Streptomyces filamentosus NRRL 15998 TaxID=457431 RepID=D6ATU4_STRFL|nr:predicted protein [Streptomyces filamentosus NRRL 15998]
MERDVVVGGRLILADGPPEDKDGCYEGHLLRLMPEGGLGSPEVLRTSFRRTTSSQRLVAAHPAVRARARVASHAALPCHRQHTCRSRPAEYK